MKKLAKDFINTGKEQFFTVESEKSRTYRFPGGEYITIEQPLKVCAKENGHRIWDANNKSHYVPAGWIHLTWEAKEGAPNFVK